MSRKTYLRALVLLAVAALLTGCGGSNEEKKLSAPFNYDASKPLNVDNSEAAIGVKGLVIRDVSFDGPDGERVNGYILYARSADKHPAVVFAHGAGGDRVELITEAAAMAKKGALTMTLEMAYSPARAPQLPTGIEGYRARTELEVQTVREVRRAVDVLRSLDNVDGDRIGYVGWSAGARMGAVVSGVDHRIKAFDLIAGGAAPVDEYVRAAPEDLKPEVRELASKTDPLRYVEHAAPSALLFQDGRQDEVVPREALQALIKAGSKPKEVRWYSTGHQPGEKAWDDAFDWLAGELDLS